METKSPAMLRAYPNAYIDLTCELVLALARKKIKYVADIVSEVKTLIIAAFRQIGLKNNA